MLNFNIHLAVERVKTIVDNTQCVTCDKLSSPCVRYPCGHSICEGCAERVGECLFCVSLSSGSYILDKPQTARVNNASTLLSAFQDAFKIDMYKRQWISDHLKVEKEVFPECIQAPQKYCNKRKSLNVSIKDKKNINQTFFPGEEVIYTNTAKMKKSFQYVQNWLNQHESIPQNLPRKPFGDVNINTQSFPYKEKKSMVQLSKGKIQMKAKNSTYMKRTHFKSINNSSSLLSNLTKQNFRNDVDEENEMNKVVKKREKSIKYKCDKNESGIVVDDEPIVVDNIEEEIIIKDKLACMAVLEAAEQDDYEDNQTLSDSGLQQCDDSDKLNVTKTYDITDNGFKGVLFYKKSFLSDPCKLCTYYINNQNHFSTQIGDNDNDVSIVINNSAFVTTIKFKQCVQSKHEKLDKKSVAIQTLPQCEINNEGNISQLKRKILVNNDLNPTKIIKPDVAIQSLDVFLTMNTENCTKLDNNNYTNVIQNDCKDSFKHIKSVIIEDSDTESNISHNNIYEVVADVHRTSVPERVGSGILTTLSKTEYHGRSNRPIRGRTPNSTDSSDKENLDPNRTKQAKFGKKQKHKIKNKYYSMNL